MVVVDNGSEEPRWQEFRAGLAADFPSATQLSERDAPAAVAAPGTLTIVRLGQNLGYAGGNNVGIRVALNSEADWVYLLNNDCVVPPNLVSDLLSAADGRSRLGAIGCRLMTFDDPPALLYGGGSRLYAFGAHWLTKWKKSEGWWPVNFVPFACVAISCQAIREVGLLDERYFAYVEDTDYSHRLRAAGWEMAVNLDVAVKHQVSASFGRRSPRYYYYVARNTPLFIGERLKGLVRPWSYACFLAQAGVLLLRLAITGRIGEAGALVRGWRDHFARVTGAMRD